MYTDPSRLHASRSRALIPIVVKPGSSAVEIGCCNGHTTAAIAASGLAAPDRCIGVDHDELQLGLARARWPDLSFHRCDALDVSALRQLLLAQGLGASEESSPQQCEGRKRQKATSTSTNRKGETRGKGGSRAAPFRDDIVLFVDINGSRELKTLIPLLNSYAAVFKPTLMVVKNWRLFHVVNSYELSSSVLASATSQVAAETATAKTRQTLADKISQNEAQIKLLQMENTSLHAAIAHNSTSSQQSLETS